MATRQEVFNVLDGERNYQVLKWGTLDERNNIGDFLIYMERELHKAKLAYYSPDEPQNVMDAIRKVTATGVAALERHGAPAR
jgi:hypothetical protein